MKISKLILIMILTLLVCANNSLGKSALLIQSTTSTKNSGFFDYILPIVQDKTGLVANVVAVGTGAAIKNAEKCNGDLLIVHAKEREEDFVKAGFGLSRKNLMYNDFIIVGPSKDPIGLSSSETIKEAFEQIAAKKYPFVSRGDDSGTNIKEQDLWKLTHVQPKMFSGLWYLEMGAGMGTTLNAGIELNAYIFTDRATWISFKNKQDYKIVFEGDPKMFNQYGIISVNPINCPGTKINETNKLIDWMTTEDGQNTIKNFYIDGQQLFFPNSQ